MNPLVDVYLANAKKWRAELSKLREVVLDCGLAEEVKWGVPVYTFQNSNVIGIGELKEACTLSFFKGSLLRDAGALLLQPGENTQAGRWIKFTSLQEIVKLEPILKAYINEAVEVAKTGLKVEYKKTSDFAIPEELQQKFDADATFKQAFESLTPGRQRGYLLHFSAAKQPKTREARIEKCIPQILCGKGIHDCTCGLSKKMPACDGSHKLALPTGME